MKVLESEGKSMEGVWESGYMEVVDSGCKKVEVSGYKVVEVEEGGYMEVELEESGYKKAEV